MWAGNLLCEIKKYYFCAREEQEINTLYNFRGKDGSADITILHELIHAATIQKIKDNSDVAESAGRLLELTRRKLEEKYGVSWEELKRSNEDKYIKHNE